MAATLGLPQAGAWLGPQRPLQDILAEQQVTMLPLGRKTNFIQGARLLKLHGVLFISTDVSPSPPAISPCRSPPSPLIKQDVVPVRSQGESSSL